MFILVSEPPIVKEPIINRIKVLSRRQYHALKESTKLKIGMLLMLFCYGPIVIFELYIMTWLRSFQGGLIEDENQVYNLYQYQGIAGCVAAIVILGFLGKLADILSIKVLLPITLLVRSLLFFMAFRINDPTKLPFYFIMPLVHVSYFGVLVTFDAYLTKMYPADLRGMMNSCQGIC